MDILCKFVNNLVLPKNIKYRLPGLYRCTILFPEIELVAKLQMDLHHRNELASLLNREHAVGISKNRDIQMRKKLIKLNYFKLVKN